MNARVMRALLIIIISLVFIALGLFTPLPYYIFSTVGVFGVLYGWVMGIKVLNQERTIDNSDVNINFTDIHPIDFDERLRKLEKLKEDHLVSEEEYILKRQEIMNERW